MSPSSPTRTCGTKAGARPPKATWEEEEESAEGREEEEESREGELAEDEEREERDEDLFWFRLSSEEGEGTPTARL